MLLLMKSAASGLSGITAKPKSHPQLRDASLHSLLAASVFVSANPGP